MRRAIEIVQDSFSGEDITNDETARNIRLVVGDKAWALDLNETSFEALTKALEPFTKNETPTSARGLLSGTTTSKSTRSSGSKKEELAAIREWAKEQGIEVSERGRIAKDVMEAFAASR